MTRIALLIFHFLFFFLYPATAQVTAYIDPRIGSEGLGRTFPGPCVPFGMAKPGPDCGTSPNAGWAPMPALVSGFSQTHVSGTGGGPKYGNILIQPGLIPQHRSHEDICLGYYACTYQETGILTEVTATRQTSVYRITYPEGTSPTLRFDLTHFLGRNPIPKAREAQQFENADIHIINDTTIAGHQTISGGWNNGAPYTVYFYATLNSPIIAHTAKKNILDLKLSSHNVLLRIGLSYINEGMARQSIMEESVLGFNALQKACTDEWEHLLSPFQIGDIPTADKRMFYTALYHTCLMPTTREDNTYDDYYAIWDTYRTSTPLLTLLDEKRATDIARSLLTIYQNDGYMPDARSGNSNGRTQGGSNGEIVLADALAKRLVLDYELALEAMLKDATVPPLDDEAEGRGGLAAYNTLGYIPYGIPRAGNRTVEYAFCDWAIAQVAHYLGREDLYRQYMQQSRRWQNLWRSDYRHDGARGFIMPRDADGKWLDDVPFGHSQRQPLTFRYTPDTSYEGPWYCKWWDCFMYEASSWEYSFSIPHDIPALIQLCGGAEAFEARLDTFFLHGYYNVANEPSFLTPCLYHWIGKPERSSQRVHSIVRRHFADTPRGLPGNDDSGAMSSWLAFHMMGLYPLAGTDQYLIHSPLIPKWKYRNLCMLTDSTLSVPTLNGTPLADWRISHRQLMTGGTLSIPALKRTDALHIDTINTIVPIDTITKDTYLLTYSLHGQTRRFQIHFEERHGSLILHWSIMRNLKLWMGTYTMTPQARQKGNSLSYLQPLDGQHVALPDTELFVMLSRQGLHEIRQNGQTTFCNTRWELTGKKDGCLHLTDVYEGAEMWVMDNEDMPLIVEMRNNPVEIDWKMEI